MVQYRWNYSALQPRNWIIAVVGLVAVVAVLVLGNRTSELARMEQSAASSPASTTGSGTGTDTATQSAPAESTRSQGSADRTGPERAPGK